MSDLDCLNEFEKEVIAVYASANMNQTVAARNIGCTRPAVRYRLMKVYGKTGRDPTVFRDLTYLVWLLTEEKRKESADGNTDSGV